MSELIGEFKLDYTVSLTTKQMVGYL